MPTRRWWQFSLRTMLLVMLAFALGLGWWAQVVRREQRQTEALRLLAECPDPLAFGYHPVAIIRAVNYLHSLGNKEALAVLHRAEMRSSSSYEHQTLKVVIPLLFDRRSPGDKFPARGSGKGEYVLALDEWKWIEVEQGIPFQTQTFDFIDPNPSSNAYLVRWAEKEGRFRMLPLRPVDDPFAAANRVMDRLGPDSYNYDAVMIQGQIYEVLTPLLSASEIGTSSPMGWIDPQWERLHKNCLNRGIHWSEREQNYAFREASSPQSRP